MKLKTLKDILRCPDCKAYGGKEFKCVGFNDLKKEAIKWVKNTREKDGMCCTCDELWIKFFNITEEDLKN